MESPPDVEILMLVRRSFQIARLFQETIERPLLVHTGLTVRELFVLRAASLGFDHPGAIARRMALAPPTVSRALATLERRGLIVRRESIGDRRRTIVETTQTTRAALDLAERVVTATIRASLPTLTSETITRAAGAMDTLWLELGIADGYPDDRTGQPEHRSG